MPKQQTVIQAKQSPIRHLTGVQVVSIGSFVPDPIVTNEDLAERGFLSHAGRLGPGAKFRRAVLAERDSGEFLRCAAGAFEIRCDCETTQPSAGTTCGAALGEATTVCHGQRALENLGKIAAIDVEPHRCRQGQGISCNQILTPELDGIEAQLTCGNFDHAFDLEGRFRPSRTAIGRGRIGVGQHRLGIHMRGRHSVDTVIDRGAPGQRHIRHRMGADIGDVFRSHGEEPPFLIKRQR